MRGAYLTLERDRAARMHYPSPVSADVALINPPSQSSERCLCPPCSLQVWDTLEATHKSYESCLKSVMAEVAAERAEVLLGSHNEVQCIFAGKRLPKVFINSLSIN